jgi:hypothetical protein
MDSVTQWQAAGFQPEAGQREGGKVFSAAPRGRPHAFDG